MSETKKSIGIITFLCPYPVTDGGRFAIFSFVNNIRKLYNVSLAFKVSPREKHHIKELTALWPDVDIQPFYTDWTSENKTVNPKQSLYKKLVAPFRKRKLKKRAKLELSSQKIAHPLYPFAPLEKEFLNFLEGFLKRKKYDVVQVEYSDLLNLVHILPKEAKKVFFQHENRYAILEDYFTLFNDASLYASYIVKTAWFSEMNLMDLFDRIFVFNSSDKSRLSYRISADKIKVISLSVPDSLVPHCQPSEKAQRLVFLGSQNHHPNVDGVKWFADEMQELVLEKTGLHLYVTGSWKNDFKLLHPDIKFTGFVDDIGTVMAGGILVAPIRLGGGGIRIKILQAMSAGIPVIATSLVVAGMEGLLQKENIYIADGVEEFITSIREIANNSDVYRKLSENGIKLINTYYNDDVNLKNVKDIFDELFDEGN